MGCVKDGQPVPLSNLSACKNRGVPQHTQAKYPASFGKVVVAKGALGAMFARDLIGQWGQNFLPLPIRFFDYRHEASE